MNKFKIPSLCLITHRHLTPSRHIQDIIFDALSCLPQGSAMVQLREKDMSDKALYELAMSLMPITRSFHTPLLINGRIDIALAVQADGVHLPQDAIPVNVARQLMKDHMLIGASSHDMDTAKHQVNQGADFVFFGPIYPTPTKTTPQSEKTLSKIASTLPVPVFAVGGIMNEIRANEALSRGAYGIAAIRLLMSSPLDTLKKVHHVITNPSSDYLREGLPSMYDSRHSRDHRRCSSGVEQRFRKP